MNIKEARKIIRDGSSKFVRLVEATNEITETEEPLFDDLLACLRHPGLPSESAAIKLYLLTGRKRKDDSVIMDYDNWREYLLKNKHIKK